MPPGDYVGCHMYGEGDDEINLPATDVFEIEDFTAATDWENFMDQLEDILRAWKLCGARPPSALKPGSRVEWKQKTAELFYLDFPFAIKLFKAVDNEDMGAEIGPSKDNSHSESRVMEDLACGNFDFVNVGPVPGTLFGFTEMLIISPAGKEILGNETRAGQVLGAVNIAVHNTNCQLPVLVQVMEPQKLLYLGTAISNNCRTELSSVMLNKKPAHVTHLTGLLQLFRNRISSPLPVEMSPVTVSVRFTHQLEDWASYTWSVEPPDLDLFTASGDTDFIQLKEIQFGCVADPVSGLLLHTTWKDLSEELIVDNAVHSDLDPLEAPEWSIEISLQEKPDCLLGRHLGAVLELCSDQRSVKYLLRDMLDTQGEGQEDSERVAGLLDRVSGGHHQVSSYSLSDIAKQVRPLRNRSPTGGPLRPQLLRYILCYLFPDSEPSPAHPYLEEAVEEEGLEYYRIPAKTCPVEGLCWRLCTTVACCLGWAGAAGVAHLLHEFCMEIRYRWENGILLPGLPQDSPPDTGTSLLNQKLQMLNSCIVRKNINAEKNSTADQEEVDSGSETDVDEFFECEEEDENTGSGGGGGRQVWETAEGRQERIGQLRLLNDQDWVYRPALQDPAPMTEDQLAEQAEILMQLGSDQAGSEVRARLQSAQLLSDMESFKAANPGCELADFVRWHSPRDWALQTGLSARMRSEGNMWTELWQQARAVTARRQRRLFDETREAEKVLQFLSGLRPGDLAQLTLPTLLQAGHLRVLRACDSGSMVQLHKDTARIIHATAKLSSLPEVRHYKGNVILPEFEERTSNAWKAVEKLTTAEVAISRLASLRRKFLYDLTVAESQEQSEAVQEMDRFVKSLCGSEGEVVVAGAARGPAGRLIQSIFKESNQVDHPRTGGLPPPLTKQFMLRCVSGRPLPSSRPTPQRLYARLGAAEFRLTGAFTLDRQYL